MARQKGRPPIQNPKNVRLDLRLTQEEADRLAECAKLLNISRTEVINRGVLMVESEINKKQE